jgi:hypothetical protein
MAPIDSKIVAALVQSQEKTAAVFALRKHAGLPPMIMRALGGGALGAALGGGVGALGAKSRGEDMGAAAGRGAMAGGALGAGAGALSHMIDPSKLTNQVAGIGAAAFGGHAVNQLASATLGISEAKEQREKEIGRFDAHQEIKLRQIAVLAPKHEEAFSQAMSDDIVSQADPHTIQSSFDTMKRFAPNLASDPNAVRSFLRESAMFGTGPSYATLKNLADAEKSVASAGGAL